MCTRERDILCESEVTLNVAMEIRCGFFQLLHARAAFLKDSFFFFYFTIFLFILSEAPFILFIF